MTSGIDPFWNSVVDAYEQVSTHPNTKARVSREDRTATVYYEPAQDTIVILVRTVIEAGRLPTSEELRGE